MRRVLVTVALTLSIHASATFAHEVDEYLQAALVSPEKDHLDVQLRLVPGAAVFQEVSAILDTNSDGVLSDNEKRAYTQRVVDDLKFSLNGQAIEPKIVSTEFPRVETMKEGLGEIHIVLRILAPPNQHKRQKFVFENHHQRAIAAYLANSLAPRDHSVKVLAQHRNEDQSRYELDYE